MFRPNKDLEKLDSEMKERVSLWLELCRLNGLFIRITEGWRSKERQYYLYAFGRFGANKTKAKVTWTLKSNHLTGKAIDFGFMDGGKFHYNGDWDLAYDLAEKVGLSSLYRKYGADRPHLEFNESFDPTKTKTIADNEKILEKRMDVAWKKVEASNAVLKYIAKLKGVVFKPYKIIQTK